MNRLTCILGIILVFATAGLAQQTVYFPQIANGMEGGTPTHWHTTIFIDNQGTGTASGTIVLFNSDGTPMMAAFVNEAGSSAASNGQIHFQLGPGQNHKYTSTAGNPLQVGYGVMTSNTPVAANLIFSRYGNNGSEFLIGEAGVPATTPMSRQGIFADTQFGNNPWTVDYDNVPNAVFSHPPIAGVGLTESEARNRFGQIKTYHSDFRPMKNVLAGRNERSLYKLVVDASTDVVVGIHMIGPDAPEILQAAAIAVKAGLRKQDFDNAIALHPTMAEELVLMR